MKFPRIHPPSEAGIVARVILIPLVLLIIWLFNSYRMGKDVRKMMRIISLVMFVVAVVFVFIALSAPTLGQTIYIGGYEFGAEYWKVCYGAYAAVMVILFGASFLIKKK